MFQHSRHQLLRPGVKRRNAKERKM